MLFVYIWIHTTPSLYPDVFVIGVYLYVYDTMPLSGCICYWCISVCIRHHASIRMYLLLVYICMYTTPCLYPDVFVIGVYLYVYDTMPLSGCICYWCISVCIRHHASIRMYLLLVYICMYTTPCLYPDVFVIGVYLDVYDTMPLSGSVLIYCSFDSK